MTNQWFRSWHGAPTDPKWLGIARKAGVPPGIVAALVWALLDRASQASERGSVAGYDADGLACFMGCEVDQVEKIVAIMHEKEILTDNTFTGWEKHQPKREDGSSERSKEWRERNRTQPNATEPEQTLDTDTDTEKKERPAQARRDREKVFEVFWEACPKKVGKGAARKAHTAALLKTDADTLLLAMKVFAARQVGKDQNFTPHPASWLNAERWLDADLVAVRQGLLTAEIWVFESSPEILAWAKHEGKMPFTYENKEHGYKRGCYRPSAFPPNTQAAAA